MHEAQKASDLMLDHWQKGTTLTALPESLRPSESADGYEIQRHVLRLTNQPLFGWKIAATSAAGQHHINVSQPLAGRILQERVSKLGDPVSCT
jgi:2-keto-4-pentenoate hydratase